jgi:8-oxo-dGTP diphosphatase
MVKSAEGKDLKEDLSNYNSDAYEKPSITVDVCICTIKNNQLEVLVIKRKHPPFKGEWAIPGGFLEPSKNETLEETAARELREETNLKNIYTEQLKTYGDPGRDPRTRVVTVVYFALLPYSVLKNRIIEARDDAEDYKWVPLRKLPKLAFDHKKILKDLLIRLMGKINYTNIAFSLLPKYFTWAELQKVFEIILGRSLTAPNFRRKIEALHHLEKVKFKKGQVIGRPPAYLSYKGMKNSIA